MDCDNAKPATRQAQNMVISEQIKAADALGEATAVWMSLTPNPIIKMANTEQIVSSCTVTLGPLTGHGTSTTSHVLNGEHVWKRKTAGGPPLSIATAVPAKRHISKVDW